MIDFSTNLVHCDVSICARALDQVYITTKSERAIGAIFIMSESKYLIGLPVQISFKDKHPNVGVVYFGHAIMTEYEFKMAPSVSVNLISLVTSCVRL